ncbi:class I SAM-dependent methyltransferase [Streptomyces sp. CAI-121]|uniref:class I SAM-dependent methyltransferase n=1 Tax=unclassified Streptomyces TaxID=2593676 RepID=UPI0015877C5F|nr:MULTISPECIES: class I SAM-dependent methyltransferase [unclassified Streptomyces]NUV69506.1 class I SAM-dependent methyltransferase [Streptomyces sp. CAI-121]NUW15649.1 class I SAM-dependent methyltransferase [Streptomyces sp. CAI-68]
MDRNVRTTDDVLALMDGLFAPEADRWTADGASWWDAFYADRSREVPFFADKPDENLDAHLRQGRIAPGRVLELGCGPGRNAVHLASLGFEVDAVDLSPAALTWARERAEEAGVGSLRFHHGDAFTLTAAGAALTGPYDLIYDSGCFHHLPPHRRISYLALLERCLAPDGHFALTCFAAGEGGMGSELPDAELYLTGGLHGGLAYTDDELRNVFSGLTEIELRRMNDEAPESPLFGESFLWTALFRRAVERAADRPAGQG